MLIIEDGSGKPDSESYADAAALVAYAGKRGSSIPDTEAEQEQLLVRAADYLQGLRWVGRAAHADQAMSWPRTGVVLHGHPLQSHIIPRQVIAAQCELAIIAMTMDLRPARSPDDPGQIVSESVSGAVAVAYADPGKSAPLVASLPSVDALLQGLVTGGVGRPGQVYAVRV